MLSKWSYRFLFTLLSFSLTFVGANLPRLANANPTIQQNAATELSQGKKLLRRGQMAEALPHLQTALRAAQCGQDANIRRLEAAAHDALGELYERQGQYDVALKHYENAQQTFSELSRQNSTSPIQIDIVPNIDGYNANLMLAKVGNMYERQGKIEEARAAYTRMYAQKPKTDELSQAKKGKETIEKARRLGSIFSGGQPSVSSAQSTVNATGSLIKTPFDSYHNALVYATQEIGLGRIEFFKDSLGEANRHFTNALESTRGELPLVGSTDKAKLYRTVARTGLADVALRQGKYADAVKLYNDAVMNAQKDKRPELAWSAQRGLGRSLWKQSATMSDATRANTLRGDALNAYREALKTLETLRAGSLRADEARTTFLATTQDVYTEAAGYFAEMSLLNGGKDMSSPLNGQALEYASEALNINEQGRARSLLEMLAESNAQITEGVPPELLNRKQENLAKQQELADQLTGINTTGEQPKKAVNDLEGELSALQTEYDGIENQIRTSSPRYASLTTNVPLTVAEIQQQVLDANTVLLEYATAKDASYLWVVTQSGINIFKLLARGSINSQAVALRDAIIPEKLRRQIIAREGDAQRGLGLADAATLNPKVAAFAAAAAGLYKTIVAPAASIVKDKRLLIVADGALNYVPFECLLTQEGGGDYSSLAYLVKTHEIVYAPSASVVAAIRAQSKTNAANTARGLLIIADPVFDANDPRARGTKSENALNADVSRGLGLGSALADVVGEKSSTGNAQTKWTLARLNGTRTEAQQITTLAKANNIKTDTWLDLDANESNVKTRDVSGYRVLHIATHGLLDTERPQFSGVVLSLVGNNGNDGFLRADEIFNLHLGHPLVMLSACETGLGKEKRGEGVIGLTRAFLYAGAPTVGVSLWSVADKSTADLMTDFYKRLLAKQNAPTSAAALRAAQQAMIESKRYSAPFYWSPFVLVGDWK
ncbi:MAG: CHAT domain-containing protein [Pyrinomonadaceae bacterium]